MRFWIFYFFIAPNVLLAIAMGLFLRRGGRTRYVFFFSSMLFQLGYFLAAIVAYLYALSDPVRLTYVYQWVVTSGLAIGTIFELGVLYELCDKLFLSGLHFWADLRKAFSWIAALLLLSASVISALLARLELARAMAVFQTLDFSANLLKIGLLLTLLLFTRVLGISWRSLPVGIALGFGISAVAEVAASALMSQPGQRGHFTVDLIRMAAFHVCVLVWLVYILLPEKKKDFDETGLRPSELESHIQELQRMVRR